MIDFNELQEIDIADLASWPIWFRWVMIFLVAGGLLFASFKYIVEPEQKTLAKLQRTEQQLKKTYLSKKELVVNLPAYKQQMLEIQDRFGVVLRQLPNRTEVPALLIDITQAGLARGLTFDQFKPAATQTKEFYITLPISIIVSGTFHQMAEFVSDLASLPRIVTVGNLSLKRKKGRQLTMKAQLYTYRYLESSTNTQSKAKTVRVQG